MNKKEFLDCFQSADKILLSNIFDKIELMKRTFKITFFNEFLKPDLWKKIELMSNKLGIKCQAYGVFKNSERRILMFTNNLDELEDYNFPIIFSKIIYKNKFKDLSHRQFMGILNSSGLKREKFGDIVKKENEFFIPCCEDIFVYLKDYLFSLKEPFEILEKDLISENIPDLAFEEFTFISPSLRLDAIVANICKLTRSSAEELLASSKILINYEIKTDKSYNLKLPCILTIRGKGKFLIEKELGQSKKEKLKILANKFI